MLSKLNDYSKK